MLPAAALAVVRERLILCWYVRDRMKTNAMSPMNNNLEYQPISPINQAINQAINQPFIHSLLVAFALSPLLLFLFYWCCFSNCFCLAGLQFDIYFNRYFRSVKVDLLVGVVEKKIVCM
jgi:hypothetical protein